MHRVFVLYCCAPCGADAVGCEDIAAACANPQPPGGGEVDAVAAGNGEVHAPVALLPLGDGGQQKGDDQDGLFHIFNNR